MQGAPYEPPINVYVRGNDMTELKRLSDELVAEIRAIPGAVDVGTTLVSGQPELVAQVDRARAADLGFSVGSVATQVRSMVEGLVPSKLREEDHEFDIRVRLAPEFRNDFMALGCHADPRARAAPSVRTGDLVRMEPGVGPSIIDREQRVRQAKIGVDLAGTRPWRRRPPTSRSSGRESRSRPTFQVGSPATGLMQESAQGLALALLLAVTFIYIVLASQFESFMDPYHHAGAAARARRRAADAAPHRQHLGMPAMIGIVLLMGLVTKNAILLVDRTNQLRREKGLGAWTRFCRRARSGCGRF